MPLRARVLVTGGAGFLGAVLVPLLLQENYLVTVVDNFLYGQTPLLDWCGHPGLTVVRDDIRVKSVIERNLRGQDAIFPLACLTGAPACAQDMTAARTTNLDAIRLLCRLKDPAQLILYPNTNSGYGVGRPGETCSEDAPLQPVSLYGRLKVAAEEAVLQAQGTVSLRLATLYGASPRMRLDLLVNDFTYRAATDGWLVLYEGHFRRSILHVLDAAKVFLWALERLAKGSFAHRVYNVAEANLTKLELCQAIDRHVPFRWFEADASRDPDQRDYEVDTGRILAEGWKPEQTLDEGIDELLQAYQIVRRRGFGNA